jgi:hypothetical protein
MPAECGAAVQAGTPMIVDDEGTLSGNGQGVFRQPLSVMRKSRGTWPVTFHQSLASVRA